MTVKQYQYQVVSVNNEAFSMIVSYKAEGFDNILVGARVPVDSETLESVVAQYAPWSVWQNLSVEFKPPAVGEKGEVVVVKDETNMTITELKTAKKAELKAAREMEIKSRMYVDDVIVEPDDHTVLMLRTAKDVLTDGTHATVDWQDGGGGWIVMDLATATKILKAVNSHIENCFTVQRELEAAVDSAVTAAEVVAIKWGE